MLVVVSNRNLSLHKAIKAGNTEAVRALLAGGADVNETNDAGQTPLIIAIVAGQHQCLRPLLRAGADPFVRDQTGLTAIDWAKRKGETQLAQSLSTHSQSEDSDTPSDAAPRPPAREPRTAPPPVDDYPRTPISADEKARRFIAGLKQRLDEKAGREPTTQPTASEEKRPLDYEQVLQSISEAVKSGMSTPDPHANASPIVPEKVASPELPRPGEIETTADQQKPSPEQVTRQTYSKAPETATPEIVTKVSVAEKPTSPIAHTPAREQAIPQTYRRAADPPPEIFEPQIPTRVDDTSEDQAFSSTSSPQKPTRSSSKRKRCPQCGTLYNSELLAYCVYDAAALVDEGESIANPRPPNAPPMLWILVVIVAILGAIAGLFVTERFLRRSNVETPTLTAPQPAPAQKGIPVLRGQLEGKEQSLIEATVPANTVKEPMSIIVRVRVDRQGRVYSADSTDENEVLREAAIEAAKKSTFSVEKLGGRRAGGTITYTFK
jgi:Ankyrin repeats (many copies)